MTNTDQCQSEEARLAAAYDAFGDGNLCYAEGMHPHYVRAVKSEVWGFDVWYERMRDVKDPESLDAWGAPVCFWFKPHMKRVDIGCPNQAVAEKLFGEGGLKNVFPILDERCSLGAGWGGREALGGGPRDADCSLDQVREAVQIVADLLRK